MLRRKTIVIAVGLPILTAAVAWVAILFAARPQGTGVDVVEEPVIVNSADLAKSTAHWSTDWRKEAQQNGLEPAEIEILAKEKMLVAGGWHRQIYYPYMSASVSSPVFITSDSLLNAFHVVFQESVVRSEQVNAQHLAELLQLAWQNLDAAEKGVRGKPELRKKARERAQIILGTALGLLDINDLSSDATVRPVIQAEIERVKAAKAIPSDGRPIDYWAQKPAWLGDGNPIDYSRFKPRGFYAEIPGLDSYFRAVSWLQSIPFRLDDDEEFLAVLLLGNSVAECRFSQFSAKRGQLESVFRCYRQFIGDNDDWDLLTVSHAVPKPLQIDLDGRSLSDQRAEFKQLAARSAPKGLINDQVRFRPNSPEEERELSFRVLSAYRTPDAMLFDRTTNGLNGQIPAGLNGLGREMPSGLEVCAALGSSFAEAKLAETESEALLAMVRQSKELFHGSSLYFDYMHCLGALFDTPPAGAPAFMLGEPWKIKSCQTTLAGWAQLRHTWALQAKETYHYFAAYGDEEEPSRPAGFVEPNPEFFARLAALIKNTEAVLKANGSFDLQKESPQCLVPTIRGLIETLEKYPHDGKRIRANPFQIVPDDRRATDTLFWALKETTNEENPSDFSREEVIKLLSKAEADLSRGDIRQYPDLQRLLRRYRDVASRWAVLEKLCQRCETLAKKELEEKDFDAADKSFFIGYGEVLAHIMFNSGGEPADDVPRIVDVFVEPTYGKCLEIGVGRARQIYILYPWKNGEILCRGAILPYYEFAHSTRLNDLQWRELLDSANPPTVPEWLSPITSPLPRKQE